MSPLHYAARYGFLDIVTLLKNYGADVNDRDCNGFTPSYWAELGKFKEIMN